MSTQSRSSETASELSDGPLLRALICEAGPVINDVPLSAVSWVSMLLLHQSGRSSRSE